MIVSYSHYSHGTPTLLSGGNESKIYMIIKNLTPYSHENGGLGRVMSFSDNVSDSSL